MRPLHVDFQLTSATHSRPKVAVMALGVLWIPLSETLHHLPLTSRVSVNLGLTILYFAAVSLLVLHARKFVLTLVVLGIFAVGLSSTLLNGYAIASGQYLLPLAAVALTLCLSLTAGELSSVARLAFIAGCLSAVFFSVDVIVDFPWHGRAGQSVAPLAVLCLITFGQYLGRWHIVAGILGAYAILIAVSTNTSRMATALTFLVIAVWLLFFSAWKLTLRVALVSVTTAAEAAYWLFNSWANERLVGRDASIVIGPLRINGEGRTEAAQILSDASQDNGGIVTFILGQGVGYTQNALGLAEFHLDKPHNEIIRLSSDVGLLGATVWFLFILVLFMRGLRAAYRVRKSPAALIYIGVSITLAGFTYSDNPLSYAWLLIPSGVLLAWALNSQRLIGSKPGASVTLDPTVLPNTHPYR